MKVTWEINETTALQTSAPLLQETNATITATAPGARIVTDARLERRVIFSAGAVTVELSREEWTWIVHLAAMGVGDDQRHRGGPPMTTD